MKIASTIARYLLGVVFLTFGLNGFLHFIPMPPPTGVAAQFFGALFVSRLYIVIFLLQIAPAILLLVNRYAPLALTILGPVIFNILAFTFSWRQQVCRWLFSSPFSGFSRFRMSGQRSKVFCNAEGTR